MSLTQEQKADRALGLGGSDAAAACGISRWKTPVQLWLEKTGQVEEENLDDKEFVQWGNLLEDVICDEWARRSGHKIRRENVSRVDREYPFMRANIDRNIVGLREGLEAKNSSAWLADEWGDDGTDEVPLFYLIQGAHYMRVYDYEAWNFAVLLGGNELRSYRTIRNEAVEASLIELETKFWDCVVNRKPPPPVNMDDLVRINPKSQGAIAADDQIQTAVADLWQVKQDVKALEKREEELKFQIGHFMGPNGDLLDASDPLLTIATYRSQKASRIDITRLRKDDPSTAAAYTVESTTRRFLVK